jgi:hypothetical protein
MRQGTGKQRFHNATRLRWLVAMAQQFANKLHRAFVLMK